MENNSDQQEIIKLLQEQNHLLGDIQHFLIKQEVRARNAAIIRFILAAIPYLALVIVVWMLYSSVQNYLHTLNDNINSLKTSFIKPLTDDISSLENAIKPLTDNISSLGNSLSAFLHKLPF